MRSGPRPGSFAANQRSYAAKVDDAYKGAAPEWVQELAACADQFGARHAADLISYSQSAVSMVLNGKTQKLDIERIEQAVRGALMGLTVDCAVQGHIGREVCLATQRQPFSAHRPDRVIQFHACRNGCPHFAKAGGSDAQS